MDQSRRDEIERRWQDINRKIAEAERTDVSPIAGVDVEFYCGQLLNELEELEYELGQAYIADRMGYESAAAEQ